MGDRLRQRGRLALQARQRGVGRGDRAACLVDSGVHIADGITYFAQGIGCLGHRGRQRILSLGRLIFKVDAGILGNARDGLAHRGDKLRVDLLLNGVGAGVGNLRSDSTLLLVDVIGELRLMVIAVEHRDEIVGEVLGDHDRRVILAALDALLGIGGRVDEGPAELVVLLELVDHLIARVELADQVVLSSLVIVGDSNLNALGISIRIPVGNDVVPGIQRGNDAYAQGNHQGDGVHKQSLDVALKDRKGYLCIG